MNNEEIVKEMQEIVEQMRIDDLEEDPNLEFETFDCDCCGKTMPLAGSVGYGRVRLCNDCVLMAELGFKLKKFENIDGLILAMEDKRLENLCEFLKEEENIIKGEQN